MQSSWALQSYIWSTKYKNQQKAKKLILKNEPRTKDYFKMIVADRIEGKVSVILWNKFSHFRNWTQNDCKSTKNIDLGVASKF